METNFVHWLISAISVVGYLTWYIWKRGIPPSISQSTYRNKFEPLLAITLLVYSYSLAVVWNDIIITTGAICIGLVAVKTNFLGDDGKKGTSDDNKVNYDLHMIGSIAGVLIYLIGTAFYGKLWIVSGIALVAIAVFYLKLIKIKNHIAWIEIFVMALSLIETYFVKVN